VRSSYDMDGGLVRRSIARGRAGRTMKKSTLVTWGRMVGFYKNIRPVPGRIAGGCGNGANLRVRPDAGVRALARRSNAISVSRRFGNALSGTMLGPSDGARSGFFVRFHEHRGDNRPQPRHGLTPRRSDARRRSCHPARPAAALNELRRHPPGNPVFGEHRQGTHVGNERVVAEADPALT